MKRIITFMFHISLTLSDLLPNVFVSDFKKNVEIYNQIKNSHSQQDDNEIYGQQALYRNFMIFKIFSS